MLYCYETHIKPSYYVVITPIVHKDTACQITVRVKMYSPELLAIKYRYQIVCSVFLHPNMFSFYCFVLNQKKKIPEKSHSLLSPSPFASVIIDFPWRDTSVWHLSLGSSVKSSFQLKLQEVAENVHV